MLPKFVRADTGGHAPGQGRTAPNLIFCSDLRRAEARMGEGGRTRVTVARASATPRGSHHSSLIARRFRPRRDARPARL